MRSFLTQLALGIVAFVAAPSLASAQAAEDTSPATAQPDPRIAQSAKVIQSSLDAWRAGDFEGWIKWYASDVVVIAPQMYIQSRKDLRAIYRPAFDMGVPAPTILDSGWTGEKVFIRQREYASANDPGMVTYAEYEVRGGRITSVNARLD